ncbi:MAG: hypothetical protein KAV41_01425 [Candidatus Pacebacteria bacterium]|nr:hypothetical protein [Candidatus Paceibacterota bacterium]
MKDIKEAFKSLGKFWFLSPEILFDIYRESKETKKTAQGTTSLSVYRQFYR